VENWTAKEMQAFKYAQLTSCDVERSFSKRNQILTPQRQSITTENMELLSVCNYYYNIQE